MTSTTPGVDSPYMMSREEAAKWACENSVEYKNNYSWFSCAGVLQFNPGDYYYNPTGYWWGYYHNGNGPYPYYPIYWHANATPPNKDCCAPATSHPIQIGVGNKRDEELDYSVGSLQIRRFYNSSERYRSAPLGIGWSQQLDYRINNPISDVAIVRRGDGTELSFTLDASMQWVGDADVTDQLIELKDGMGVRTGWRYRSAKSSQVEIYDEAGLLQNIYFASGGTLAVVYTDGTDGAGSGNGGYVLDAAGAPTSATLPAGLLLRVTDDFGHSVTYGYDSLSHITVVSNQTGALLRYAYDVSGNLSTVTYADGAVKTYLYGEPGYLASGSSEPNLLTGIVDEAGNRYASYWYDTLGRAYDEKLAEGSLTNVDRSQLGYTVNGSGDITSTALTDALGTTRTYQFTKVQGVNRLTSVSLPGGVGGAFADASYDANGNATSHTDFKGSKECSAYDSQRNLRTVTVEGLASATTCPGDLGSYVVPASSVQRKTGSQWHPDWRKESRRAAPKKITTLVYQGQPDPTNGNSIAQCAPPDALLPDGKPIAVVCKKAEQETTDVTGTLGFAATNSTLAPRVQAFSYNRYGRPLTMDGPRSDVADVATKTYYNCSAGYQCGQIETTTNAAGHVTTYNTYNVHGQPLQITDPNGTITILTYDLRQRLTSRTVGTEQTTFDYWPTGLLKKATLPDGSFLEYTYDAAHRLTRINDAQANSIVYTLDAMGNRTKEESFDSSSLLARTRSQVFDTLNHLSQQLGAAGTAAVTTTFGYDNNGNQTSIDAPLARSTEQTYDELNRLSSVTDPDSGLTQYGYDALDQLISVTDPRGLATTYTYNGLGDLKQQVSPDTGTTNNTYDSGGNLKTSTDARNAITTYTYDALNRIKTASFKVGSTTDQNITYNYDAGTNGKGRLTSASDANHSMSWVYDSLGRVTSKSQAQGTITQTVGYGYTNGLQTSLTTPSGQTVVYSYSDGQVSGITINGSQLLSNVLYDPFGPARQWSWGNGTLSVRTFDEDGKITQLDSAGLNTYAYDDAFRITGITDTSNSNLSWTYGYDALDRLTAASTPTQILGWNYDATSNRLSQTGSSASTFNISATSNRLSNVTGALVRSYVYDNAGNITNNGSRTFTYNYRGRMKSTTAGSATVSYTFNALGQRIKKSGTVRLFVYDESGHLLGEYSSTGALVQETIWLGDTPVATIRPKTGGVDTFYVHTDHLNTPRKVTRPSDNKLRWRWDSTPFGTGTPNEDPQSLGAFNYNLRFPGQYYDQETGLHYNYYRDYDPSTGRYVESDPIGLRGGINTYSYAKENAVMYVDVLGLKCGSGWSDKVVSDTPFGVDISDCCQAHDDCYGDCFNSPPKSTCDQRFRACIYQKCAGLSGIDLWTCHLVAEGYPWGVDNRIGNDAFKNARAQDPKQHIFGGLTMGGLMRGRRW